MKKETHKGHVDVSPLTYSSKGFSRPRFLITLLLTIIVSLSLVVGGTMTFFGMSSDHYVTVNGKELITSDILESLREQLSQPGLTEQQKMGGLMQALRPREESLTWMFYGENHGIVFQASDLYDAMKEIYQEQKQNYEKEYKSYYSLSYPDFVKRSTEDMSLQATFKALSVPNTPDDYNISQEYTAEHTSSIVKYEYTSVNSYLLKTQESDIASFYTQGTHKVISGKTLLVLSFPSAQEADQEAKKFEKDPNLAKTRFQSISTTLTVDKNLDSDTYLYVQNTDVGKISPSFSYRGKNYVGKVTQNQYLPFEKLSSEERNSLASDYANSLEKSKIAQIRETIQKTLQDHTKQPYILTGTTFPITLEAMNNIRSSTSPEALPFASSTNKEFFSYAFAEEKSESPILKYQDIYYRIQVFKKNQPVFPIPSSEYSKIQEDLKSREDNLWILSHREQMQKGVKVKIDTKNLQQLLQ